MNAQSQMLAVVSCFYVLLHVSLGQGGDGPGMQCMTSMQACDVAFMQSMGQGFGTIGPLMEQCGKQTQMLECLDAVKGNKNCEMMVGSIRQNVKALLVDSKICDKKEEAKKYSACFAKSEITAGCQPGSEEPKCDTFLQQVNCLADNTKEHCGQPQSDLMRFVAKAVSRNIAKNLGKNCPKLENTSGVEKFVPMSVVILGLLASLVGVLVLN